MISVSAITDRLSSDQLHSNQLHLWLLGSPRQSINGQELTGFRSTKTQALLYYLAVTGEPHQRAALTALFWPNAPETKASSSLRNALSSLRKLAPEQLQIDRHYVAVQADRVWLDTHHFSRLLQATAPAVAMQQHQAAAALYTGDFLAGFHVDDAPEVELWITTTRAYFQQAMVNTLMALSRWYAADRDPAACLATLSRLLTMAPGNEAAHQLMMKVLATTGQRDAAIQQFDTCRRYLVDELGVDPAPETMALYAQLLEGAVVDEASTPSGGMAPVGDFPSGRAAVSQQYIDPGNMPGRMSFQGRTQQLHALTTWLVQEDTALVGISGMGGIGKTALAAEVVHRLAEAPAAGGFTRVIWRSLINTPKLGALLDDWLYTLMQLPAERLPVELDAKLALLFAELARQRVLLVLDNVESIMAPGEQTGEFRDDFDAYRQLLERMAHGHHQSCLLLTTREVPRGLVRLPADYAHVHHLALTGLTAEQGIALLRERQVTDTDATLRALVDHYSGNPLALKLVAATIQDLYNGDVEAFLTDDVLVFDDVRSVLDQHFARLSGLGRDLLIWLAINREPVGFDALGSDLVVGATRREVLEAVRALKRSSLLQEVAPQVAIRGIDAGSAPRLALHNVVMEYLTDRLFATFQSELKAGRADYFHRYALRKANALEHIQAVQIRLFTMPLAQWLAHHVGLADARQWLRTLLDRARQDPILAKGYTATNVVHLMLQLSPRLQGENLSGLSLLQADLRAATLSAVDLRNTDLSGARFTDSFGIVTSVAVSPDGQFVAAGAGRSLVVWRRRTLQLTLSSKEHSRNIAQVAFAPDGRHLASADFNGTILIWDLPTGDLVHRIRSHVGDLLSIAFSPDSETLVGGGYNGYIGLWHWRRADALGTLEPDARILALAFAPTGELLANVGYYGEIQAWDIHTQQLLYTLRNENPVYVTHATMAVGRSFILSQQGNTIIAWDQGKRSLSFMLHGNKGWIDSLALSPDESQIAGADTDGAILLWDIQTHQPQRVLEGHQGSVRALAYTPDGLSVISGGYDETVRIWNIHSGLEEARLQGHAHWIYLLTFSPNGLFVAGVTLTGAIYLWDGDDLRLRHTRQGHKSAIRAPAFSPDSRLFATGSDDGTIRIWDVQSGELRHTLRGHTRYVRLVAFDHSGCYLASSSYDNTIRLWDVDTGRLRNIVSHSSGNTMEWIAFHPHRALLAYTDTDNHVYLWDVEQEQPAVDIETATQPKMLAFTPDGRYLACGAYDGSVTLWEVKTDGSHIKLAERCCFQPSTQSAWVLAFSPDSSLLAWNGEQRAVYVASLKDDAVLCGVPGTHLAHCIAFSADGKQLVTDGSGFDLFIYDALTGEASKTLVGHGANLTAIVANPTSPTVASSDAAGVVKLWHVATGTLLATAQLNGPYMGTNITGATGLTQGQRQSLRALGAVEEGM